MARKGGFQILSAVMYIKIIAHPKSFIKLLQLNRSTSVEKKEKTFSVIKTCKGSNLIKIQKKRRIANADKEV